MEPSREQQRRNNIVLSLQFVWVCLVAFSYVLGSIGSCAHANHISPLTAVLYVYQDFARLHLFYPWNIGTLGGVVVALLISGIIGIIVYFNLQRRTTYSLHKAAGDGGFATEKENQEYNETYLAKTEEERKQYELEYLTEEDRAVITAAQGTISLDDFDTMILSETYRRHIIARKTLGNNNILVVGGAGSGKSWKVIKPNIMQMNASFVITDPSGELITCCGDSLRKHGYKIRILNIADMEHSNCYNPFHYIRNEAGVRMMIDCFISNTSKSEQNGDNQFFVDAEKLIYSACIFYLIEFCRDEEMRNFNTVLKMILSSNNGELAATDPRLKAAKGPERSEFEKLFEMLPHDSLAYQNYKSYMLAPSRTRQAIVISALTRLQPFMTKQVRNLTRIDQMELDRIGEEKTAIFVINNQANKTYNFLASMMYTQLFETHYQKGEDRIQLGQPSESVIPVRCLLDEFANSATRSAAKKVKETYKTAA